MKRAYRLLQSPRSPSVAHDEGACAPLPSTPAGRLTNGPRGPQLPKLPSQKTHITPPAFAVWLLELARSAQVARAA
jgi:hypothetical protein